MIPKNKKNRNSSKEIAFSIFLVILFIGLITFAIISNMRVDAKRKEYLRQIEELQKQIKDAEENKKNLEKSVSQSGSQDYLEEVARKQFGLKSPGEEVVVVSKENEKEEAVKKEDAKKEEKNIWDPRTWWEWISGKR